MLKLKEKKKTYIICDGLNLNEDSVWSQLVCHVSEMHTPSVRVSLNLTINTETTRK